MNAMEKKIKERAEQRQAKLTKEERQGINELAKKLASSITPEVKENAKKAVGGKAKPKTKKISGASEPAKQNGVTEKKNNTKKTKTQSTTSTKTTKVEPTGDILTTKEVAAMVGTTPKALRRVLRAKWYNDGVTTNYRWTKDDPILKEILDYYKKEAK